MTSKVFSAALLGLDCQLVEVEADTSMSLPGICVVGLPDKAVDESKERVRSAIKNSWLQVPRSKITINLAPADVKKIGPVYDLPIAVSILLATRQIKPLKSRCLFIGELSLDGSLRPINGILPISLAAKKWGINEIFLPKDNASEAAIVRGLTVYACDSLRQLVDNLNEKNKILPHEFDIKNLKVVYSNDCDMADIKGQGQAKRALEIAAAGGHNILMSGPPGAGKTMLAKALATILPKMTLPEALEVTKIYSVAGVLPAGQALMLQRPFRSPHHTASGVALVGGGSWPRPGEITLAHRGVLFLDEFPEFSRPVLENLRQPLEDGIIHVSRASATIEFPAKFILVAAMNPCPCGYLNDEERNCVCMPSQIIKYQKRISGPLLDRIDLHIEVPKVKFEKLTAQDKEENSLSIRQRVQSARLLQLKRFAGQGIFTNSEMSSRQVKNICVVDARTTELLRQAVTRLNLTARSYFRILKLARTIADLAGQEKILLEHTAEALQYRPKVE